MSCNDRKCSNCKHWMADEQLPKRWDYDGCDYTNVIAPSHGLCTKAEMWDRGWKDESDVPAMVAMDGSEYMANLYTHADHCCKEFSK